MLSGQMVHCILVIGLMYLREWSEGVKSTSVILEVIFVNGPNRPFSFLRLGLFLFLRCRQNPVYQGKSIKHLRREKIRKALGTVGTKIIADPEKCFRELIAEKLLILFRDRPCLGLIIVSSNFQALLFLQGKVLESVWKLLIPVKKC